MILPEIVEIWQKMRAQRPLTHVITHQIAANDAANLLLAVGARPIMVEHPDEVADVARAADSVVLSLGNITPSRLEAIERAGKAVSGEKPLLLDAVGVAVSPLRLIFARRFIESCRPAIIKGNISELLALVGGEHHAVGVDAGDADALAADWRDSKAVAMLREYAASANAVVLATGENDLVTDGEQTVLLKNGAPLLGQITATGCMLAALIGALAAISPPFAATTTATAAYGIMGELAAAKAAGPGSFHSALFDAAFQVDGDIIAAKMRAEKM